MGIWEASGNLLKAMMKGFRIDLEIILLFWI